MPRPSRGPATAGGPAAAARRAGGTPACHRRRREQRLEQAAAKAGGEISSEQIDLAGPDAKDGFITLTASLDIAQPALQGLLYDLETGAPFLIIPSLDVQSPLATGGDAQGPMRVTLALTGKWEAKP